MVPLEAKALSEMLPRVAAQDLLTGDLPSIKNHKRGSGEAPQSNKS